VRFGGNSGEICLSYISSVSLENSHPNQLSQPEYGGSMFLWNVRTCGHYTAWKIKKITTWSTTTTKT